MELIKKTIRVGNSAGVLLPIDWYGSYVKVILERPSPSKEVIELLTKYNLLEKVIGAYLVGSYARNEQTDQSDVDILVITENSNKKIKEGLYEILCISKENLEKELENNAFPILPMLKEGKTIINPDLLKKYSNFEINAKNMSIQLKSIKSAIGIIKEDIQFSKENNENASDASAYSLILRLRTIYIIECIKKNKIWSKKEFLETIKKVSGSCMAYERYLTSKNKNTLKNELKLEEAERLLEYITIKSKEIEKWLLERKD